MFPKPKSVLVPNTYEFESGPMVKATGFREYDARWLFEKEINLMGVQALGMGLGALIAELGVKQEVVTGHDFRSYSASIKYALISGLQAAGCGGYRPQRAPAASQRHLRLLVYTDSVASASPSSVEGIFQHVYQYHRVDTYARLLGVKEIL